MQPPRRLGAWWPLCQPPVDSGVRYPFARRVAGGASLLSAKAKMMAAKPRSRLNRVRPTSNGARLCACSHGTLLPCSFCSARSALAGSESCTYRACSPEKCPAGPPQEPTGRLRIRRHEKDRRFLPPNYGSPPRACQNNRIETLKFNVARGVNKGFKKNA